MGLWTAKSVSAGYNAQRVLSGLNFEVQKGEILGVIGVNGAGKSSLLKLILGLLKPTSGDVLWEGRPFHKMGPHQRSQCVSMVEAHPFCTFPMTVLDLVRLAAADDNHVQKAIEIAGITSLLGKNVLELSSGETKRSFVAHLLAQNAQMILADEVFSNLDWAFKYHLIKGLHAWRKQFGTTFVISIHELDLVPLLVDRVLLLHDGRLKELGAPKDVLGSQEFEDAFGVPYSKINAQHK